MAATLADLIKMQVTRDAKTAERKPLAVVADDSYLEGKTPTQSPQWLVEAFAKLDDMSARCDALIERNGVWTRYRTGGDDNV